MSDNSRSSLVPFGIVLAAGLAVSGWLVGSAIRHFKDAERYVTVKGLAEREVAANLAIWPVVYSVSGNDLSELQTRLEQDGARIEAFLRGRGFSEAEASRSASVPGSAAACPANAVTPPSRCRSANSITLMIEKISRVPQMNSDGPSTAIAPTASRLPRAPFFSSKLPATKITLTNAASRPPRARMVWIM